MELWEPALEPRRDHAGQSPARRQMGISAHAKKHQQAPRTVFVTDLSCRQGKIQLSASQHRVPGCKGTPLTPRSGRVRGEQAAAAEEGAPPKCPSHPTAHHLHLRPPHQPPQSRQESADKISHGHLQRARGESTKKSQQRSRRLLCTERESHTCGTSYEMKIHPNANLGL